MISTPRRIALSLLSAGLLSCSVLCALLMSGCAKVRIPEPPPPPVKDYERPLPAGMPALRKITDPARLPDFRAAFDADREGLLTALDLSLGWFAKPSSKDKSTSRSRTSRMSARPRAWRLSGRS